MSVWYKFSLGSLVNKISVEFVCGNVEIGCYESDLRFALYRTTIGSSCNQTSFNGDLVAFDENSGFNLLPELIDVTVGTETYLLQVAVPGEYGAYATLGKVRVSG